MAHGRRCIIDILNNNVTDPSAIYSVLAQKHGVKEAVGDLWKHHLPADAGLGDQFDPGHGKIKAAFTIKEKTATVASPEQLLELAHCFRDGLENFSANNNKYATCLALLYNYLARHHANNTIKKECFIELYALYIEGPLKSNSEVCMWLKSNKPLFDTSIDADIEKYRHKPNNLKSLLERAKETASNLVRHVEEKLQEKENPKTTVTNILKEMIQKTDNDLQIHKRLQKDFLIEQLKNMQLEVLECLLKIMEETQTSEEKNPLQPGEFSTYFKTIRTKRIWNDGKPTSTATWQELMSKVKAALLEKIQQNNKKPNDTDHQHYQELFSFHSSSFFKLNLKNNPSRAAATEQEYLAWYNQKSNA